LKTQQNTFTMCINLRKYTKILFWLETQNLSSKPNHLHSKTRALFGRFIPHPISVHKISSLHNGVTIQWILVTSKLSFLATRFAWSISNLRFNIHLHLDNNLTSNIRNKILKITNKLRKLTHLSRIV